MKSQVCVKCNVKKPTTEYYLRKRKLVSGEIKTYPRRDCKACSGIRTTVWFSNTENKKTVRENQAIWRSKNKDRCENARLKYRFGITLDDYNQLLKLQGGKCAICGITSNKNKRNHKFHVDHCHTTEAVRGLLCNNCNVSLGGFRDDTVLLQAAIKYLTDPPNSARLRDTGTPSDTV